MLEKQDVMKPGSILWVDKTYGGLERFYLDKLDEIAASPKVFGADELYRVLRVLELLRSRPIFNGEYLRVPM